MHIQETLLWLGKVSRYPFFWWCFSGPFIFGVVAAGGHVPVFETVILFLWFAIPAALFFGALNDAYDWQTDAQNPRKQDLEQASKKGDRKKMLTVAFVSLCTSVGILPFFNISMLIAFIVWLCCVLLYNMPPVRLKSVPVLNVLFGGVGMVLPTALMGYALVSGTFPSVEYVLFGIVFLAAGHISAGDALDFEYDRNANIHTIAVWIGSAQGALVLGFVLYCISTVMLWMFDFKLASICSIAFPVYTMYVVIYRSDISNKVQTFKFFQYLHIGYWACMVTVYITIDIMQPFLQLGN